MSISAWQCGHLPFLPATLAGVRTSLPHDLQSNSIEPEAAGFDGLAGDSRMAARFRFFIASGAADVELGIRNFDSQLGHWPIFPAADAGVETLCWQLGQKN